MTCQTSKPLRQATTEVLQDLGPTDYQEVTEWILRRGLAISSSKTTAASLNATVAVETKRNGNMSEFVRVPLGVFGLSALHAAGAKTGTATAAAPGGCTMGSPPFAWEG